MSLTLFETFSQIDPFVRFNDGTRIRTAGEICEYADSTDPTEYALGTDGMGLIVVYRLNVRGCIVSPPSYVEEKRERSSEHLLAPEFTPFAAGFHGFL